MNMNQAYRDYKKWFKLYPEIKNPTDINRQEKFEFAMSIGWKRFRNMQRARKQNTRENGFPAQWTMAEYWEE